MELNWYHIFVMLLGELVAWVGGKAWWKGSYVVLGMGMRALVWNTKRAKFGGSFPGQDTKNILTLSPYV